MFQWEYRGKLYFLDLSETNEQVTVIPTTPNMRMKGKHIRPARDGSEFTTIRTPTQV